MPEPFPAFTCEQCGTEHEKLDCLVLLDFRQTPCFYYAWCDEGCLEEWVNSGAAQELFTRGGP